jgi:hypothetical protein
LIVVLRNNNNITGLDRYDWPRTSKANLRNLGPTTLQYFDQLSCNLWCKLIAIS